MNRMNSFKFNEHYTISQLRKKSVICKDNLILGHIIDVVFDSDLKLHSFIIGGNHWEEIKEFLGIMDDIDPVIPVETIESINKDSIKLSIIKSQIRHKLIEGVIPPNSFTYSSLKRKHIHDKLENKFGKIVNLVFLPSSETILIIGGSWFEEIAEKLKFKENSDLVLPFKYIDSINEKRIRLSVPYEDLRISINNIPMDEEAQRKYFDSQVVSGNLEMRLIERRNSIEVSDFGRFQMKRT